MGQEEETGVLEGNIELIEALKRASAAVEKQSLSSSLHQSASSEAVERGGRNTRPQKRHGKFR